MEVLNKTSLRIIIQRLFITISIILFIRIGNLIPIPLINQVELEIYLQTTSLTQSFLSNYLGRETFVISLFTLNIFPYINASILTQFLLVSSPSLSQLQKDRDLNARRELNKLTRTITLIWSVAQSSILIFYLKQILFNLSFFSIIQIICCLTTGSMIILWLSELITEKGLGTGPILLIYTNIISTLPVILKSFAPQTAINTNNESNIISISIIVFSIFVIIGLQEGVRVIPLMTAKQLTLPRKKQKRFQQTYLPLKLNQGGVMPIILTATVLVIPDYISKLNIFPNITFTNLGFISTIFYWFSYFSLISIFSLFYSKIVLNPKIISDQLQNMSVSIPGIRPGIETNFYLKKVMQRLTIMGALTLGILDSIPTIFEKILTNYTFNGLTITSLLITVNVLADISKEIDEIIFSNVYKNNIATLK